MPFHQTEERAPVMPNVFVTPPEEDDAPPWCCFDAANPLQYQVIKAEPEYVRPILGAEEEDKIFYSNAQVLETVGTKTSIVDAAIYGKHGFTEVDEDIDIETISDYGHELEEEGDGEERMKTSRDAANDSDVVEVVKVRRGYDDDEPPVPAIPVVKTKKSLKHRASSAFKSFTGSFRSKRRDTSASVSSSRSTTSSVSASRSRTPTDLRQKSSILSQLFKSPPEVDPNPTSLSTLSQDELRLSASSPAPSTSSRFSSSRRFSRLSLRNLFSFNSDDLQASDITTPTPTPTAPFPPPILTSVPTSASASSSSFSAGWPETPTNVEHQIPMSMPEQHIESAALDTLDSFFDPTHNLDLGLSINPTKANFPTSTVSPPMTPRKSTSTVYTTVSTATSNSIPTSTSRRSTSTIGSVSVWGSITPKLSRIKVPSTSATSGSTSPRSSTSGLVEEDEDPDTSLEMRLDSLHFDSISFDVEKFSL